MKLSPLLPRTSIAALVLGYAPLAHAFEGQWHVGGGAGAAGMTGAGFAAGPALGLHAAYGLSDVFDARFEASFSRHRYQNDDAADVLMTACLGAAYKLDVIEWIPYGGLAVGYHRFLTELSPEIGTGPETRGIDLSLIVGLDYAASRSFGVGFQFRQMLYLEDLSAATFSIGLLRAEYRWGF